MLTSSVAWPAAARASRLKRHSTASPRAASFAFMHRCARASSAIDAVDLGLLPFQPLDALAEFRQRDLELRHLAVAEIVEVEHLAHFLEREADGLAGQHIGQARAVAARIEPLLAARRGSSSPFSS